MKKFKVGLLTMSDGRPYLHNLQYDMNMGYQKQIRERLEATGLVEVVEGSAHTTLAFCICGPCRSRRWPKSFCATSGSWPARCRRRRTCSRSFPRSQTRCARRSARSIPNGRPAPISSSRTPHPIHNPSTELKSTRGNDHEEIQSWSFNHV